MLFCRNVYKLLHSNQSVKCQSYSILQYYDNGIWLGFLLGKTADVPFQNLLKLCRGNSCSLFPHPPNLKVEELYEAYCIQCRLRDGATNMKHAFSLSPSTKASRESLVELYKNFQECTEVGNATHM